MFDFHRSLRVQFAAGPCAAVGDIALVLRLLDDAYNGLYRWLVFCRGDNGAWGSVPLKQRLCLAAIETVAPAQLEIVGVGAVLDRLAAFLRQSPRSGGRSSADIELLQRDLATARARGLPDKEIDDALKRLLVAPLWALNEYAQAASAQDADLVLADEE